MINAISSWTQGIIVAVIVGTIIEMIFPEGKNKKYAKTVIGVYILFSIISPLINEDIFKSFNYEEFFNTTQYENVSTNINLNPNTDIEKIYKNNLSQDIINKLKEKDYKVIKIDLEVELENDEVYGKVNKISLNIIKNTTSSSENNQINTIKIENVIIDNTIIQSENNNVYTLTNEDTKIIKQFLNEQYGVETNNIKIN